MTLQLDLAEASAAPTGTDPFAAARAAHPEARLLLVLDRRPGGAGEQHILAVPPSSPWHALLPPEQVCEIRHRDDNNKITSDQYAALAADPAVIVVPVANGAG